MDELQEFVYEVYKTSWHKDELATILRNSETNLSLMNMKIFCGLLFFVCKLYYIVL
jgi:hypothetical protein